MKKIKVKRTVEEIVAYKAFDGTRFKTKDECKAYENSAKGVIKKRLFDKIKRHDKCSGLFLGCCDDILCSIEIKNGDDLQVVKQYCEIIGSYDSFLESDIGKTIYFVLPPYWEDDGYICRLGTGDEIINIIKVQLDGDLSENEGEDDDE